MARLWPLLAPAVLFGTARADDDAPEGINGFVTYGAGEITGRVVDLDNRALRGGEVHIVPDVGKEVVVKTDKDGRFRGKLGGQTSAVVYVREKARITAQVSVPSPEH